MPSLRLWLQSSSLLAVVAGYSVLFAVSRGITDADRLDRHQQLVSTIGRGLQTRAINLPLPSGFGVEAQWKTSAQPVATRRIQRADGSTWLVTRSVFPGNVDGQRALEIRQNITASVQRGERDLLLLTAAAGASALLTSGFLRVVIWRGLILPLRTLTAELEQLEADSLGARSLKASDQPDELQPIVAAFNQLQKRLADAWQRERSFVDGVAHELRTPITVISSHAQSLQRNPSSPAASVVALIVAEAERMAQLISLMLDFARSDSGRLNLERTSLDMELLLLEAFERMSGLAPQRLRLGPAPSAGVGLVQADTDRVQQCLMALVDNALRYSQADVLLSVSSTADAVTLHVCDRGPGIAAYERPLVVQRFVRGAASIGTRGSGIGLATVSMLMQAMDGKLVIADRPGGGADLQLCFRLLDRQSAP